MQNSLRPAVTVVVTSDPGPDRVARWDRLVLDHPAADVTQLSGWAGLRAGSGYEPLYVLSEADDVLRGGALVLVRRVPGLGAVGYVPYGPLVAPDVDDADAVRGGIAEALAELTRRRVRMLFVQPPEGEERTSALLADRRFRPSAAWVAPAASLRVDLDGDEAQLRRNLSRRLRPHLNQAQAREVTVRVGSEADLPLVARLMQETGEYQGFTPFDLDYLTTMHRLLAPAGGLLPFIGEVAGEAVTASVFTSCGRSLRYRFAGFTRAPEVRQFNVPAVVMWEGMLWAKQRGYRWFDFGGVLPESVPVLSGDGPVDVEALAGPDQFKQRFGGELVRYPAAVERITSPVARLAYDVAHKFSALRPVLEWARERARGTSH